MQTLIASYPKSGRTWLSFMIANYLNLKFRLVPEVNFESVYQIINSDGAPVTPLKAMTERHIPNFCASHALPDQVTADRVIRITRNPHDVIVSFYFHLTKHWVNYSGTLSDFLRDEKWGVPNFKRHHDAWEKETDIPTLRITYANLQSNTEEVLSQTLEFGIVDQIDPKTVQRAVELSCIDAMRRHEQTGPRIPQHQYDLSDVNALRVRIGKVGSAEQILLQADADYISEELSIAPIRCSKAGI